MFNDSFFAQEEARNVRRIIVIDAIVFIYPCNLTPIPSPTGRGELRENLSTTIRGYPLSIKHESCSG
jgi:hypothetical protein